MPTMISPIRAPADFSSFSPLRLTPRSESSRIFAPAERMRAAIDAARIGIITQERRLSCHCPQMKMTPIPAPNDESDLMMFARFSPKSDLISATFAARNSERSPAELASSSKYSVSLRSRARMPSERSLQVRCSLATPKQTSSRAVTIIERSEPPASAAKYMAA
jgi:hypothetical protein